MATESSTGVLSSLISDSHSDGWPTRTSPQGEINRWNVPITCSVALPKPDAAQSFRNRSLV
jgi:hypothetical protein